MEELKPWLAGTEFAALSERALAALWREFSNIQAANWIIANDETVARFLMWLRTGDDEQAWS